MQVNHLKKCMPLYNGVMRSQKRRQLIQKRGSYPKNQLRSVLEAVTDVHSTLRGHDLVGSELELEPDSNFISFYGISGFLFVFNIYSHIIAYKNTCFLTLLLDRDVELNLIKNKCNLI
jgi:hypothetical protein